MDKHQVIHQNRVQEVANFAVTSIATLTSENKLVLQKILEAHVLVSDSSLYSNILLNFGFPRSFKFLTKT